MALKSNFHRLAAICASLSLFAPLCATGAEIPGMVLAAREEIADQRFSVAVTYSDLDLLGEEGVRLLRDRVSMAAKLACGPSDASSSYYDIRRGYKRCVTRSVARASSDIDLVIANARSDGRLASTGFSIRVARR